MIVLCQNKLPLRRYLLNFDNSGGYIVLMKKYLFLIHMLLAAIFSENVYATHIYGGDLLYTHTSGNEYLITLTLYGDCSGSAFSRLHNAKPSVTIYKDAVNIGTIDLFEDVSQRKEVSPVCASEAHNTACRSDGDKSLPGVMMFVYTASVTMEPANLWEMVFEGNMGNSTSAGRSNSITNILFGGSGQVMTLIATLNNSNGHNSSPAYTTIPTPFYCINKAQQYNQGAADPDNDSLYFSLVDALRTKTLTVTYNSPRTAIDPLETKDGTFSFNNLNGQMDFTPDAIQRSLVVNKVEEYKNGVLVGSSMREMTFIVLSNCDNAPPSGTIDLSTVNGAYLSTDYTVNVCDATSEIKFSIPVFDINNNAVNVTLTNIPQGAVADIVNNNSQTPVINFSWKPQDPISGTYNIFATYKDDACPLSSSITVAYTIKVSTPPKPAHDDIHLCLYDSSVEMFSTAIDGGIINWYDLQGNKYADKPTYTTDTAQTLQWLVSQTIGECESFKDTFNVYVHDTPAINITNAGGTACYGEGMTLVAEGGVRYEWYPVDEIEMRDSAPYVYVLEPGEYAVIGYSEYQCENTDTLVFDKVLQCCQFSYPNAFTPNNDGVNDRWSPITYGTIEYFQLAIYNRWGERVFVSTSHEDLWDGTFRGKQCDVGMYFYLLKAGCLTGQEEESAGTVMLIR